VQQGAPFDSAALASQPLFLLALAQSKPICINEDTQMAVNKKSLTNSKPATKPAATKSKAAAPSPATAATALRTARSLNQISALRVGNS